MTSNWTGYVVYLAKIKSETVKRKWKKGQKTVESRLLSNNPVVKPKYSVAGQTWILRQGHHGRTSP